jgi:hypothetical protein
MFGSKKPIHGSIAEDDDGGNGNGEATLEIRDGVWDPRFAAVTGLIALALIVLEVVIASGFTNTVGKGLEVTTIDEASVLNGIFLERFVATLSIIGMTIGVGSLTIGSWLAGLELRARLSKPSAANKAVVIQSSNSREEKFLLDPKAVGEAVSVVVEKLGRVRGTIAVLVAGMVITVASLLVGGGVVINLSGECCESSDDGGSGTSESTDNPSPGDEAPAPGDDGGT